jgi:saccharopine dehydrogenase-like NADP-dependent oxidoreductase
MKKVLLLGYGAMGKAVDAYLAGQYYIIRADKSKDWGTIQCDFSDTAAVRELIADTKPHLVVCCAPSTLGQGCVRAAIEEEVDCIDLSFSNEDPFALDEAAKEAGVTVVVDAGLAPGLTNLFVGRELSLRSHIRSVDLYVGGVSTNPWAPYGYAVTWSVEDLLEEYKRTARWVSDHEIVKCTPFQNIKPVEVRGIRMEAFYSDGLRTLLRRKDRIRRMVEATLRWPGHTRAVKTLVENGTFVEQLKDCCKGQLDTVAFKAQFRNDKWQMYKVVTMVYHGTKVRTAMSKTTGLACSVFAEAVLEGVYKEPGVSAPEDVGENAIAFQYILDKLAEHDVVFHVEVNDEERT